LPKADNNYEEDSEKFGGWFISNWEK